jgi:hypothetical protein
MQTSSLFYVGQKVDEDTIEVVEFTDNKETNESVRTRVMHISISGHGEATYTDAFIAGTILELFLDGTSENLVFLAVHPNQQQARACLENDFMAVCVEKTDMFRDMLSHKVDYILGFVYKGNNNDVKMKLCTQITYSDDYPKFSYQLSETGAEDFLVWKNNTLQIESGYKKIIKEVMTEAAPTPEDVKLLEDEDFLNSATLNYYFYYLRQCYLDDDEFDDDLGEPDSPYLN